MIQQALIRLLDHRVAADGRGPGGHGRDHGRAGHPGADRRLPDRPAAEGRNRRRGGRVRRRHARPRRPCAGARRRSAGGHLRHRRRRAAHVQHLDHRGVRGGRRRASASPSTATAPSAARAAAPTCWRRWASTSNWGRRSGPLPGRGGRRLHVRAALSPGDAPCRAGAPRTRRAHRLQCARPADQPCRGERARCSAWPTPGRRGSSPVPWPAGHPPRAGGPRRRRAGRDQPERADRLLRGPRRAGRAARRSRSAPRSSA